MAASVAFRFRNLESVRGKVAELGLDLALDDDLSPLGLPLAVGPNRLPNRLGIHPLEGADGTPAGAPDELTFRRYRRFAQGGSGLIWFEATAVTPPGRANGHQLTILPENLSAFSRLVEETQRAAAETFGPSHQPLLVLQLTHSGRVSKPGSQPQPVIAQRHPFLDRYYGLGPDYPVITDDELDRLQEDFVRAAQLALQAGFHAVDVKACHGYLLCELLSARTRPGRYGGDFAGRTRFLLDTFAAIRQTVGDRLLLTTRLNLYERYPYPYGWGASQEDPNRIDLEEPLRLVQLLVERGLAMLNVSAGNGQQPELNRPYARLSAGGMKTDDHPFQGIARLLSLGQAAQEAFPSLPVVATGYSGLRQFSGNAAAASIRRGGCQVAAVGRMALAYPDFARDLLERGRLDPRRTCITCGKCTTTMKGGGPAGCVTRDSDIFLPVYRRQQVAARQ